MTTVLTAAGLGKRYRSRWALQDCSISVPAGRVVALVGPNGAGKTTLLHLAIGLLRPNAGTVEVLGAPPRHRPDVLAQVGFVAQDKPLYSTFTVADTLRFGQRLNRTWDQQAAGRRLARLGIGLGTRIRTLSGGQRAQVSLALSLGKRPRLLLLDEPLAELDPMARQEFMSTLMEEVAARELTVVFSSHVITELDQVCDHLILLGAARVQLSGDIDDLRGAHKLLIGPRRDLPADGRLGPHHVVAASHTERQTSVLARMNGPLFDSSWAARDVGLDELILAYMRDPAQAAPPRLQILSAGREVS